MRGNEVVRFLDFLLLLRGNEIADDVLSLDPTEQSVVLSLDPASATEPPGRDFYRALFVSSIIESLKSIFIGGISLLLVVAGCLFLWRVAV